MGKYTENDAARDTGASKSETASAWHTARDDAQSVGELNERASSKGADSVQRDSSFHDRAVSSATKFGNDVSKDLGSSGK